MSGAFDPLAQKAVQTDAAAASDGYDPLAAVASGKQLPAANEPSAAASSSSSAPTWEQDWLKHGNPINQFVQGAFDQAITSTGGAIAGGLKGLWDIATGRKEAAPGDVERLEQQMAYKPETAAQRAGAEFETGTLPGGEKLPLGNPLNWPADLVGLPGNAASALGKGAGHLAESLGAPPIVSTLAETAPAAALSIAGLRQAGIKPGEGYVPEVERVASEPATSPAPPAAASQPELSATGAPRPAPFLGAEGEEPKPPVGTLGATSAAPPAPRPDGPPVEGGLPKEAQAERQAILQRVGVTQARKSALEGDAKAAATDYQVSKTDEPGGNEASAQFDHERNALTDFAQRQITRAGGTIGMDEDALINRGQTIAKPFDALRQWFKDRTKQLYAQAQQRSDELAANGNPNAYTQLQGVDQLLKSPGFRNTLMAKDQGGLLASMQAQLEHFRETNPNGFTPAAAEQFRQWLNQVWSPDKSWAISQVTDAIDKDVFDQAGENIYGPARAIRALRSTTLDDPNGISQLFDHDPKTPINRSTPLEKIPDRIMSLPLEQFDNLIQTLKKMPPELQEQAQAAMGEIKGQLLNRLLKAGTETRAGRGAQLWRGQEVSQALARHAGKFRIAFQDDPEARAAITDLNSAGQILHAPQGYPGAYAQATNLAKRGVGSAIVRQVGRGAGAAVGGAFGNPVTAVAGELAGSALGERAAAALDEKSALKNWRKRVVSLEGR